MTKTKPATKRPIVPTTAMLNIGRQLRSETFSLDESCIPEHMSELLRKLDGP